MASKTKTCPGCGTKAAYDAVNCPNCPYSWPEEGSEDKKRHGRHSAGPFVLAVLYLSAGVGIWKVLSFVTDAGGSDKMMGEPAPRRVEGGPVPAPAPPPPAPVMPPIEDEEPKTITITEKEDAREWRLRGVVYDLITLKPIGKVAVTLQDPESDRRLETMTDASGRYRVTVPSLKRHGYNVILRHPDYAPTYLNPGTENVPQKPELERAETAAELARSLGEPYSVQPHGGAPLITDFYLAPRSTGR